MPGREFKARINDISVLARVDFQLGLAADQNFALNLILVDADPKIRPGMTAVARIATERVPDVVLVPAESVFQQRRRAGRLPARRLGVRRDARSRCSAGARNRRSSASGLKPGDRIAQRRRRRRS